MVPEGVAAFFAFLALVAPGLAYELLRERSRPALKESSFREASRVALSSLVLTSASVIALGYARAHLPFEVADPHAWMSEGNRYLVDNLTVAVRGLALVVIVSCAGAYLFHRVSNSWRSRFRRRGIVKTSVWYQLFEEDVPRGMAPWVRILLKDGSVVWGYVDFFSVEQEMANREISVRGPRLTSRGPGDAETAEEKYWRTVIVRGEEISKIKVRYEPAVRSKGLRAKVRDVLSSARRRLRLK